MNRSRILLLVALFCAIAATVSLIFYVFAAPTPLRIAVGPVGSEDTKLVVTILQTFQREKHSIRLRLVPSDGPVGSAEMLRDGKADLAIVRSDGNIPPNAATVAIMHRDVALLLATPSSDIRSIADLRDRKVGIVRGFNLNRRLLDYVLERHGIDPASVEKISLRSVDVRQAVAERKVDAIFTLGPTSGALIGTLYFDFSAGIGNEMPVILPITESEALAQRNPLLEAATILRGTFGGSPPRPSENIETLQVSHRLVADRGIRDSVITELTKALFEIRQSVAADVPMGARIEAPNTEAPSPLVIHPGAAAYIDGEQKTFIEQYGEWIYIGVMGFGLMGSLVAGLMSRVSAKARPAGSSDLDRILLLLRRARSSKSFEDLELIQKEADDGLARIVERAAESDIDEPVLSAFTIALGELRNAIEDRRKVLSTEQIAGLAE